MPEALWEVRLAQNVMAEDHILPLSEDQMDQLLNWLGVREQTGPSPLDDAFDLHSTAYNDAKILTLQALEKDLFYSGNSHPETILGIFSAMEEDQIVRRYRRLLNLFHPDKLQNLGLQVSNQAEKLNKAFATLKSRGFRVNHGKPEVQSSTFARKHNSRKKEFVELTPSHGLRTRFGSPKKFKEKIVLWGIIISLAILGLLSLSG